MIFLFFSALWILFSDRVLLIFIDNVELMTVIQTAKGWFFIVITTILIFNLLRSEIRKVDKMEKQLIQNEKVISISHMAAGMANQINNPLAGIVQNAQIIRNRLTLDKKANLDAAQELGLDFQKIAAYMEKREIHRILDSLVKSGRDASDLIENMLSFSATESREKEMCNLTNLMDRTIELFVRDDRYRDCRFERKYRLSPQVFCDVAGMQHVFYHIIKNSLDAMTNSELAPVLSLTMENRGHNFIIIAEDIGTGINDKIFDRIFEPFFSTREGSLGLGLSISRYIITEIHNGSLHLENREKKGSRVSISIPLVS